MRNASSDPPCQDSAHGRVVHRRAALLAVGLAAADVDGLHDAAEHHEGRAAAPRAVDEPGDRPAEPEQMAVRLRSPRVGQRRPGADAARRRLDRAGERRAERGRAARSERVVRARRQRDAQGRLAAAVERQPLRGAVAPGVGAVRRPRGGLHGRERNRELHDAFGSGRAGSRRGGQRRQHRTRDGALHAGVSRASMIRVWPSRARAAASPSAVAEGASKRWKQVSSSGRNVVRR